MSSNRRLARLRLATAWLAFDCPFPTYDSHECTSEVTRGHDFQDAELSMDPRQSKHLKLLLLLLLSWNLLWTCAGAEVHASTNSAASHLPAMCSASHSQLCCQRLSQAVCCPQECQHRSTPRHIGGGGACRAETRAKVLILSMSWQGMQQVRGVQPRNRQVGVRFCVTSLLAFL